MESTDKAYRIQTAKSLSDKIKGTGLKTIYIRKSFEVESEI